MRSYIFRADLGLQKIPIRILNEFFLNVMHKNCTLVDDCVNFEGAVQTIVSAFSRIFSYLKVKSLRRPRTVEILIGGCPSAWVMYPHIITFFSPLE